MTRSDVQVVYVDWYTFAKYGQPGLFMKSILQVIEKVYRFLLPAASQAHFSIALILVLISFSAIRNAVWLTECGLWKDVVLKAPGKARGYYCLGIENGKKGLTEKAIDYYKKAIRLNPNYAEAHNNLGFAYGKLGMSKEDLTHTLRAVQLNPDFAGAHFNLGVIYSEWGAFLDAQREFETVLRIQPDYPEARMFLDSVKRELSRGRVQNTARPGH